MESLDFLFVYYVGLLVFGLNGLVWVGMMNSEKAKRYEENRLRKLLMRAKLRKGKF